ncbi:MAG: hypothetical protein ABIK89_10380, partial [Planctomycetota bacterium]
PLPPAALAAIQPQNEIRIENRVGDAFKVRNFRLRLQAEVGITSKMNLETYSTGGWEYAEGRLFQLRQTFTGIGVQIPMEDAASK